MDVRYVLMNLYLALEKLKRLEVASDANQTRKESIVICIEDAFDAIMRNSEKQTDLEFLKEK